ncbi:MAG TPA: AAA family ATPase [Chitinophaga sp.]|uniref:exopolysaccharide transport family protein n=1 Tax=Chitinophaga sp. TaxID=1869181 RepID=UPI002BBADA06|nr:AAA family ATPase [Chitinophaga sp.]HVI48683.1 AAA family ATPase [Chitinophaga sp.]
MDITFLLKALIKKKWWIILSTIIAVVAAFAFTIGKPKLYLSTAQMSTGYTTNEQIKLRDENVNLFEADVKFDNVIETVNSPLVMGLLSCDLLIHDLTDPKPFRTLTEQELKKPAYTEVKKEDILRICKQKLDSLQVISSSLPEERKVLEFMKLYKYDYESLRKMINVGRLTRTDYININCYAENPELSAFTVNTLYREFIRFYRSSRSERSGENVNTFESLVNQKKTELDQKVEALRGYKTSQGVLNVETASGNEMDLIKQFEGSLTDERANSNTFQASLDNVNNQLSQMNSNKPVYGTSNGDIVSLRKQINELNDEYTRTGSNDNELADKIKGLRSKLQRSMVEMSSPTGKVVSREELQQRKGELEAQLSASRLNISTLEGKIARLRSSLGSYANKEATVTTLESEVKLAQDEYNKLKEKLSSALDNRNVPLDNFRQTLKGQPAFTPEKSKRMMIMGMAGFAVFMISCISILFAEFMDSSIKSPSVFNRSTNLKLISTINHANLTRHGILEILQKKSSEAQWLKRQNIFRELLRKLRFELEHSSRKIFLFTSTEPQQGKTTLLQAVAYSLSLSNKKVLVIDTNFCNNDLTVQMEANPTLESFSVPPSEFNIGKIKEIVTTYATPGIEVIGCKGGDYTPSEILPANHLLNYLQELKQHYDYILMEGAPLNDFTDSKELAVYAEGVVAIFSSHLRMKQIDKESSEFLEQLGDKFIGAVLNDVKEDFIEL